MISGDMLALITILATEISTYPIANVRQSADGAIAVTAIWSIVREEICSEVVGSKRIILPLEFPEQKAALVSVRPSNKLVNCITHQRRHFHFASRQRK